MKLWQRFVGWRLRVWEQRLKDCADLEDANRRLDELCVQVTGRRYQHDPFCAKYERRRLERAQRRCDFWIYRVPIEEGATSGK